MVKVKSIKHHAMKKTYGGVESIVLHIVKPWHQMDVVALYEAHSCHPSFCILILISAMPKHFHAFPIECGFPMCTYYVLF
jgi:hypothetical protein